MPNRRKKWELLAAAAFVLIHLTSPFWIGELYPFTISPMFCDSPQTCCKYEVFDEDGSQLDANQFNLHMVYDGNPPGLGMGISPQPTLHLFGEVATREEVVNHVREILNSKDGPSTKRVVVHQHRFFAENYQIRQEEKIWTVDAEETGE